MEPSLVDFVKDYCKEFEIDTKPGPGAPTLNGVEITADTVRSLFTEVASENPTS
jgi:hypothetical protein